MMDTSQRYQISPSQLSAHKDCAEKWHYSYGMGYRSIGNETFFQKGSYFHELSHFYYQLIKSGFEVDSPALIAAMKSKLKDDFSKAPVGLIPIYVETQIMWMRYMNDRSPQIDQGIKIIAVEYEVRYYHEPLDLDFMGILDLAYRDRKGQLWLRDHKTGANASAHGADKMPTQDQLLFYSVFWYLIFGEIPGFEVNWINSKTDYRTEPTLDKLFKTARYIPTKVELEAFWTYLQEYVYAMQSNPPLRKIGSNCARCPFNEPCMLSLRGEDVSVILANKYKKVDRKYEFRHFTEYAKQHTSFNLTLGQSGITLTG